MKFKYKKAILFSLISTMGIGVVTLSIAPNKNNAQESINITENQAAKDITPINILSTDKLTTDVTPTLPVTLTPTPIPTPTPLPVYELEEEGYPNIDELIKNYYEAKLDCNIEKLKKLLTDPSDVPSKKQMQKDIQFIEEYRNIKCYVKKGYEEGTYIVFAYNDVKIFNIKTPIPSADQFYILTESNGDLKILSGDLEEETKKYYYDRREDKDVIKLIEDIEKKVEKAKKKDKDLKVFLNSLQKS